MEAGRRLGADRKSGALELLLSTPLRVDDILRGQGLALLRQFGVAVALVCAVDFLFLGLGFKRFNDGAGVWVAVWLAGIAMFVFDLITLALLTMWLSLTSPKSTHASGTAIVRVCVVPWLIFGAIGTGLAILEDFFQVRPLSSKLSEYFFVGFWFVLSCANNILLSVWSLHRLRTRFRIVVMERPESRAAFWGRWLGRKMAGIKK
jgi:ABC-type Na+ efflux pump permease subunit